MWRTLLSLALLALLFIQITDCHESRSTANYSTFVFPLGFCCCACEVRLCVFNQMTALLESFGQFIQPACSHLNGRSWLRPAGCVLRFLASGTRGLLRASSLSVIVFAAAAVLALRFDLRKFISPTASICNTYEYITHMSADR